MSLRRKYHSMARDEGQERERFHFIFYTFFTQKKHNESVEGHISMIKCRTLAVENS